MRYIDKNDVESEISEPKRHLRWDRLFAVFAVLAYLSFACIQHDLGLFLRMMIYLLLPLACIWFPEIMGKSTRSIALMASRPTPETFVKFSGWLLLALPLIAGLVAGVVNHSLTRN